SLYVYNKSVAAYTPIQDIEDAESLVVDFFELHNYTLLPDAIYDGINFYDYPTNPMYTAHFHQEINQTLITFSETHFSIDATYGIIEHFTYKWIVVENLPMNRIIAVDEIPRIVLDSFNDSTMANVLDIELRLELIDFNPDAPDFVMRLVYRAKVVRWNAYFYYIDAISGEILNKEALWSNALLIVYSPYFQIAIMLAIALTASLFSYYFLRKRKQSLE
ncbi:MAG: hypothetical protein P1Q69_10370, partial [Candidatus Thorarchaeota archaeon]|nr:hypothetical protein [Candidatus Thorarchaeota archaeon]